jgi:ribonuclease P protein component
MQPYASLRRTSDFSRLRQRGRRIPTGALTIYRSDPSRGDKLPFVGIAVGKTVGKAVVRNKVRRRIVAILRAALAGRAAFRLLVVAQPAAARASFASLETQLASGLSA